MAPPKTSHQALEAKPENSTAGFATPKTTPSRKKSSVVTGSANRPKAQEAMAKPMRIAAADDSGGRDRAVRGRARDHRGQRGERDGLGEGKTQAGKGHREGRAGTAPETRARTVHIEAHLPLDETPPLEGGGGGGGGVRGISGQGARSQRRTTRLPPATLRVALPLKGISFSAIAPLQARHARAGVGAAPRACYAPVTDATTYAASSRARVGSVMANKVYPSADAALAGCCATA